MGTINIPKECYRRPMGTRFDPDAEKRVNDVLAAKEKEIVTTIEEEQEKKEFLDNLIEYRSKINPKTSYNAGRKSPKTHKSRRLTVEYLREFLDAVSWTPQYFLELLLTENKKFDAADCLDPSKLEGWAELTWPSIEMAELAECLDRQNEATLTKIEKYVSSTFPPSYYALFVDLMPPSKELSWDDKTLPKYVLDHPERYPIQTKVANLSDRIYTTIKYLSNNDTDVNSKIKEIGINVDTNRLLHPRHNWVFGPKDFKKLCDTFKLSPHWVFYGPSSVPQLKYYRSFEPRKLRDIYQLTSQGKFHIHASSPIHISYLQSKHSNNLKNHCDRLQDPHWVLYGPDSSPLIKYYSPNKVIKNIERLYKTFDNSPNWIFSGSDSTPLLMKNSHAEMIMDMVSLHLPMTQTMLCKAIVKALDEPKNT